MKPYTIPALARYLGLAAETIRQRILRKVYPGAKRDKSTGWRWEIPASEINRKPRMGRPPKQQEKPK